MCVSTYYVCTYICIYKQTCISMHVYIHVCSVRVCMYIYMNVHTTRLSVEKAIHIITHINDYSDSDIDT